MYYTRVTWGWLGRLRRPTGHVPAFNRYPIPDNLRVCRASLRSSKYSTSQVKIESGSFSMCFSFRTMFDQFFQNNSTFSFWTSYILVFFGCRFLQIEMFFRTKHMFVLYSSLHPVLLYFTATAGESLLSVLPTHFSDQIRTICTREFGDLYSIHSNWIRALTFISFLLDFRAGENVFYTRNQPFNVQFDESGYRFYCICLPALSSKCSISWLPEGG